MNDTTSMKVTCPSCRHAFELADAVRNRLEGELREDLHREHEATLLRARGELEAQLAERYRNEAAAEVQRKDAELEQARMRVKAAQAKELELARREREMEEGQQRAALEHEEALAAEVRRVREETAAHHQRAAAALLAAKDQELERARARANDASRKEAELLRKERELEDQRQTAEAELEARLAAEVQRARLDAAEAATQRATCAHQAEMKVKDLELAKARDAAAAADRKELELARLQRELEESRLRLQIEHERKLQAMAAELRRETMEEWQRERSTHAQREQEHKQAIEKLEREVGELHRRLRQGPVQIQGEAAEVLLRDVLVRRFPRDRIEEVPVGTLGADLIQVVIDDQGRECGSIIWESKRTKNWSAEWLPKLRQDQRNASAACAVIVSQALPPDVDGLGAKDGVWLCSWQNTHALAYLLRSAMQEIAAARRAGEGQDTKMKKLYDYLTGSDFGGRIRGVLEAFQKLRTGLDQERTSMQRIWARREKELERALENLTAFYGAVEGIAGESLAGHDLFELPEPANDAPSAA